MNASEKLYTVTVTPKFAGWAGNVQSKAFDVQVKAISKRDANKRARAMLEREGHIFTHDDAATFKAREATDAEARAYAAPSHDFE